MSMQPHAQNAPAGKTLDQFAREVLHGYLAKVETEALRAGEDPSEEPVHDVRVAIRRWSQALRLFSDLLPHGTAKKMRREARALLDAAGAVRDYDIGADLVRKEKLREDHPLLRSWETHRDRGSLAVRGQVYLFRAAETARKWAAIVDGAMTPREPADDVARRCLPEAAAGFFEAGRRAAQRVDSTERLHAFRLAAKRFRYTLEIFAPLYGPALRQRIEQVREIQTILGNRQDAAVTAERLRPLAVVDAEIAGTLARVETRGARLQERFLRYWHQAFDAAGECERWQRYLSRRRPVRRMAAA
jgi:CHAD domain-containing protein